MPDIGIVIIGRNEGERLLRCLRSITTFDRAVYIDSGSTDGSVEAAKAMGIPVQSLDPTYAFSAARARNQGFSYLTQKHPDLYAVQFIDADSELSQGWLAAAKEVLLAQQDNVSIVVGRIHERQYRSSIYKRISDIGWKFPLGLIDACGGLFMIRCQTFNQLHGFNEKLIAGEDINLCYRARNMGQQILSIDHDMAIHDIAITSFGQWWRRCRRTGWTHAALANAHKDHVGNQDRRRLLRALFWGIGTPFLILLCLVSPFAHSISTLGALSAVIVALLYIWVLTRTMRWVLSLGKPRTDACLYAVFSTLSKTAEGCGVVEYYMRSPRRDLLHLFEYK